MDETYYIRIYVSQELWTPKYSSTQGTTDVCRDYSTFCSDLMNALRYGLKDRLKVVLVQKLYTGHNQLRNGQTDREYRRYQYLTVPSAVYYVINI